MCKKTLHHCISIIREQKRASNIDWSQACVQLPPPLRKNLERSICDLPLRIYIVFKDLMTFSGICLMKQLTSHHATTGFHVKWCLRKKCRNSTLMKHHCTSDWMKQFSTNQKHYSDLGNDTADQYGISALVSQMSFCGETSEGIAKCWLFSEVILECVEDDVICCYPRLLHHWKSKFSLAFIFAGLTSLKKIWYKKSMEIIKFGQCWSLSIMYAKL